MNFKTLATTLFTIMFVAACGGGGGGGDSTPTPTPAPTPAPTPEPTPEPTPAPDSEPVWINEFHYDNAGTDANEFIEIAGVAGTDLNGYTLVLYSDPGVTSGHYANIELS